MFVRPLNPDEVLSALHLIWEVYASDVAPLQNPEAVAGFRELIRYEHIMPRIQNKEVILFGAWERTELCGVGGINNRGNVLFLYVRKEWMRKGVARQLMQEMYQFCAQVLVITRMTVRAVPASVTAFNHLGFREVAPVQNVGAEIFVPMELLIAPGSIPAKKPKKRIALIIVGICLLIALLICMVVKEAASIVQESDTYAEDQENPLGDYGNGDSGEYDFGMGDGSETEQQSGLDQIPEYEAEDLPFEVKDETYNYSPENQASVTQQFEIYYPQLDGMENQDIQAKVNDELKNCAMETVDRIYENPDNEIRNRVLEAESPVIADFVKYKVTYLTQDYICVAYEDYSYEGNSEYSYVGLRTKNINLKDGTVYDVKDIVNTDKTFVNKWLKEMQSEADDKSLLADQNTDSLAKVLSGEDTQNGTFTPVFFMDKDGIEIGLSFHYDKEDENAPDYGWVTAPFQLNDLKDSKTDSTFWDLVK